MSASAVSIDDIAPRVAATNLLVEAPSMTPNGKRACSELFCADAPRRIVAVTYTEPPDEWLARYRRHATTPPESVSFVSVGANDGVVDGPEGEVRVDAITDAGDLSTLGLTVCEQLDEMKSEADDPARVRLCFDPVSVLVGLVGVERVFRFLHVLAARVRAMGLTAHYHVDPTSHDDRERNALTSLFDGVVTVPSPGSGWTVRTR